MVNPILLKSGTQKGGIRVHFGTKFGYITINTHKVICDYSLKITPICCCAYHAWQETENWYRGD